MPIRLLWVKGIDLARLLTNGFELDSATAGMEFVSTDGSPTTAQSSSRKGKVANITSLSSGTPMDFRAQFAAAGGSNGPYFGRIVVAIPTAPSAENRIISIKDTNANADRAYFTVDSSRQLRLYNGAGTLIGSPSAALLSSTYYRLEWKIDRTPAGGSQVIEAMIDGTVFATSSTETITTSAGDTVIVGGNLASEAQTTGQFLFDDLAVNDSTGSYQTSYPGNGSVRHLVPDANGDLNEWTASAGSNFRCVQEATPNDSTDYVSDALTSKTDFFNVLAAIPGGTDQINLVAVGVRFNNPTADATTSFQVQAKKIANGTISSSSSITPNSTTWRTNAAGSAICNPHPLIMYVDPDNYPWTLQAISSLQIGVKTGTIGVFGVQVTAIWAVIDYVPNFHKDVPNAIYRVDGFQ